MPRAIANTKHKHYVLNEAKIKRAQKLLGTATETETIEQALDIVLAERERSRTAWQAHRRFLASGIQIRDVYGLLSSDEES
jgi:hypothetical protein